MSHSSCHQGLAQRGNPLSNPSVASAFSLEYQENFVLVSLWVLFIFPLLMKAISAGTVKEEVGIIAEDAKSRNAMLF